MCHLWIYSKPCERCLLTFPYTTKQAPCANLVNKKEFGSCFPVTGAKKIRAGGQTKDAEDYSWWCRTCVKALKEGGLRIPSKKILQEEEKKYGKRDGNVISFDLREDVNFIELI